jgi:hypothetical protein
MLRDTTVWCCKLADSAGYTLEYIGWWLTAIYLTLTGRIR